MGALEDQGNFKPNYRKDQDDLWREIRKLWTGIGLARGQQVREGVFSFSGDLSLGVINDLSPPYFVHGASGELFKVIIGLGTAGTSNTTIGIYKMGTLITGGSLTLGSGVKRISQEFNENFVGDVEDTRVAFTAIGAGAVDLTIQCRYR